MPTVLDPAIATLDSGLETGFESAEEQAGYTEWLQAKIAASLADPRPSIPHDEAMAYIRRTIETLKHNAQGDA